MKMRLLTILGLTCILTMTAMAQDYDDIYYDSSKEEKEVEEAVHQGTASGDVATVDADYSADWHSNIVDLRDVDEYNRRGNYSTQSEAGDTVYVDSTLVDSDSFQYTERIRRFHNPDVVEECGDAEAVDLYVYTRPDVNIVVGTPTTAYVSPWGATVSFSTWGVGWYDPWYDPWYFDPWYYRPYWYYTASWYNPWYWGWGPYYAHHHHHYHDWWHSVPSHYPYRGSGGGRRLYANTGYRGYATGTTAARAGRTASIGRRGTANVSNRAVSSGTRRPVTTIANNTNRINRATTTVRNNAINRYKARVGRVSTSGKLATTNRVNAMAGNRVSQGAMNTGNRINRSTTRRPVTATATTTARQRTNQLNRRSTLNNRSSFSTRPSTGYRSTSRGSSYYRSNRSSTATYNGSTPSYNSSRTMPSYRSSRATSTYNRGSSSSYRSSATRSSGMSRGGGAMRSGGGGGRGRR